MKTKYADFEVKSNDGIYSITASTGDIDRDGEVILPSSFKNSLETYLKHNPVILYGHDYSRPPVGKATGGRVTDSSLELDIEFAPTPFAQEIKSLYDGGFMNSFSVGFIPRDGQFDETKGAFTYTDCELLETSCVTIPSNRAATMIRDAEAKGLCLDSCKKEFGVVDPMIDSKIDEVTEVILADELVKSPYLGIAENYLRKTK